MYFNERPLRDDEKVAFLFPGQGVQYLNMGGDLPQYFPIVKEMFHKVFCFLPPNIAKFLPSMLSNEDGAEFFDKDDYLNNLLMHPRYNHPAVIALGAVVLEVLLRVGIKPDVVAGHSLGEYLALYAAGVFDLETLIKIVTTRGEDFGGNDFNKGVMVSVGASADEVSEMLKKFKNVTIANKNCPVQTVISGDMDAVKKVVSSFERRGILCKQLPVVGAFHNPSLYRCVDSFRQFLCGFKVRHPRLPVQCNLTGKPYRVDKDFSSYLCDALSKELVSPVEFINNILSLYESGVRLFIEVGPKSTLCSFVDNILKDRPHLSVATNVPTRGATLQLLHAMAFCAACGLPVDIDAAFPKLNRGRISRGLPAKIDVYSERENSISVRKKSIFEEDGFIKETLADQKVDMIEEYINKRRDFLKEMVRLDFRHFIEKNIVASEVKEKPEVRRIDPIEERVVEIISRKTGYPPEAIDIDFDVEAELGLDSIKQVEVIQEIAKEFNIDFGKDIRSQRYHITTPRKLIELCKTLMPKGHLLKDEYESKEFMMPSTLSTRREEALHTNCYRWICRKIKMPLTGKREPKLLAGKRILLLCEDDKLGRLLKEHIRREGADVYILMPQSASKKLSYDFDLVLNLWSYSNNEFSFKDDIEVWWEKIKRHAKHIFEICKGISRYLQEEGDRHIRWVEVTALGGDLGASFVECISSSAGINLGITRCLACEFPKQFDCLYLDFSPHQLPEEVVSCVVEELMHKKMHTEVGYIGKERFMITWERDNSLVNDNINLDEHSVILAIGGARGITASVCRKIAQKTGARFIIVGRAHVSLDSDEELKRPIAFDEARKEILQNMRQEGRQIIPAEIDRLAWKMVWDQERQWNIKYLSKISSEVVYRQCDITDFAQVTRLIEEIKDRYGKIDLVIQGASDLLEKATVDINIEEFTERMKSKALGTASLLVALLKIDVGVFINFSSVAGRWGNKGQAVYAAGHEVAAILVSGMRKLRKGRWINIFFGPWLGIGMIRIGAVMERLFAKKADFITEDAGSAFFIKEFSSGANHNIAFCGRSSIRTLDVEEEAELCTLLDNVEVISSDIAKGKRLFDLKRDYFVADHYVYYNTPILPGVVGLEMIAQTASVLVPKGFLVTDVEDIQFLSPGVFLRREPKEFYTRVTILSKEANMLWCKGEVFSFFTVPGGGGFKEKVHMRCKIKFGHRLIPPLPSLLVVDVGLGKCVVDAAPVWDTKARCRRLGVFRSIKSFSSVTPYEITGEVRGAKVDKFGPHPFLNNPICLDGLIDMVTFLTDIFEESGAYIIEKIESIEFFDTNSPEGERFCHTSVRKITNDCIVYDVESIDNSGKVAERIKGIRRPIRRDIKIKLTEPIWDTLRENPRQKDIKSLLNYEDKLIFAQAKIPLVHSSLKANGSKLLKMYLTPEEEEFYYTLKHFKRQREWLAGRIVAKRAVQVYLGKNSPVPCTIEIGKLSDNKPYVVIKNNKVNLAVPYISISHSNDVAVASASAYPDIGIDVEKVKESILEIADEFSSPGEIDIVTENTGFRKESLLTIIWAIKEAARKVIGPGRCSMKELVIKNVYKRDDYLIARLHYCSKEYIDTVGLIEDGYAYAVSRIVTNNKDNI